MKKEYQAIIVGSGPAGAACAKALKNAGIEVLVIEKDKYGGNSHDHRTIAADEMLKEEVIIFLDFLFAIG